MPTLELVVPSPDAPRWLPLAASQPADLKLSVPVEILFGETADIARFVANFLESKRVDGKVTVPGLQTANRKNAKLRFDDKTATDTLSLMATCQAAQTRYKLTVPASGSGDTRERAHGDLDELTSALELIFDDGVEDEHDRQLAQLDQEHGETSNDDTLAAALADYAGLARQPEVYAELTELSEQGGFELAVVERCEGHVNALRMLPAAPRPKDPAALEAFEQRNRLVNLLQQQVRLIRAGARWVFRKQPTIARQATSAYDRRKRAEARRKKAAQAPVS